MKYFLICIAFHLSLAGYCQDKKAKRLLDEISSAFEDYQSFELDLSLEIQYPERELIRQNVKLIQKGHKFYFESADQVFFGDGENVWLYLKDRNEVQINNFDGEEDLGIPTPKSILAEYRSGQYEYRTLEENTNSISIEFKPPMDSDYSKFKMDIRKQEKEVEEVLVFNKDGSVIKMQVDNLVKNRNYSPETFVFRSDLYPGVYIEDLRID